MRIQFVNPHNTSNMYAAPKFFRFASTISTSLNFKAKGALFPPLNLATLAALTPPEHEVAIDDGCLGPVEATRSAEMVAITAMTAQAPAAYELADQYRARGIPVVLGGIHPSMCPDEAGEHADAVVLGEADRLWPDLIQDFLNGKMKSRYYDPEPVDLAKIALPRRDLLDSNGYVIFNSVQTTRGCPFNCNFCSVTTMSGVKYRFRPAEQVVEELRTLDGRFIYFVDDNIIGNPQRAKALFKAFLPLKLGWASQVTINFARDPDLMRLARASGCYGVFIGFETFSNKSIRDAGKGVNRPDEYLRDIRRIHEAGIKVWGSFIFGFDNDALDVFRETLDFIEQSRMEFAQFSLLTPLPGTALYKQFEDEQRIVLRDWSKYDLGAIVFNHPLLSAERLHFEKNYAWRRFYSIRSIRRRLGMPKTRGDLILWIANLAVTGALKYRWGKEYWTWNGKDSDSVAPTEPRLISRTQPLKVKEAERLVKVASAQN
ncbi:MAG: B12-binding domain-containing radical SAM protein [Acidobacteria bacterium]|nr:B12-binding domain-containing radical SAM protein [Acidobacteriota bacterium]